MSQEKNPNTSDYAKEINKALKGKKIQRIEYQKGESDWWPVLILEGGGEIVIQQDDESNGPGVPVFYPSREANGTSFGLWEVHLF